MSICSPLNREELFNLRHALIHNIIKRIFRVLKCHFHIILLPTEYLMDTQVKISAVLCAIHNFIHFHADNNNNNKSSDQDSCKDDDSDGILHMNKQEDMNIPDADATNNTDGTIKAVAGCHCSSNVEQLLGHSSTVQS